MQICPSMIGSVSSSNISSHTFFILIRHKEVERIEMKLLNELYTFLCRKVTGPLDSKNTFEKDVLVYFGSSLPAVGVE